MLSYQHMYHAGCLADVQKHAALALMLSQMTTKDKPLTYIETHAGRGLYDLASAEAQKTGEAAEGIERLLEKFPPDHAYARAIAAIRATHGASAYPGSPLVAAGLVRKTDRLHLMELHPQEYQALREVMRGAAAVKQCDGFKEVLSMSPPPIKRGFVLIDPSYEVKSDYDAAAQFVLDLHKKWPVAVILLWYPILSFGLHIPMAKTLAAGDFPKFWQQEILFAHPKKLALGTGLIAVNTPYGIAAELEALKKIVEG